MWFGNVSYLRRCRIRPWLLQVQPKRRAVNFSVFLKKFSLLRCNRVYMYSRYKSPPIVNSMREGCLDVSQTFKKFFSNHRLLTFVRNFLDVSVVFSAVIVTLFLHFKLCMCWSISLFIYNKRAKWPLTILYKTQSTIKHNTTQ